MRDLTAVKGFLTPAMTGKNPDGSELNAFSDWRAIDMISKGYACGECCAIFTGFRLNCPACEQPTHVTNRMQPAPALWQQHMDQRYAPIRTELIEGERELELPPDVRRTSEMFIADVQNDSDIEQTPLSKLKPSKWGRK